MLLNNTDAYSRIWDWIDNELGFSPSCSYTGHDLNAFPPFRISGPYAVYGIENMNEEQAILETYDRFQQAMIDKDIDTLNSLVTEDIVFTHMSGKQQTKEEFFGEYTGN